MRILRPQLRPSLDYFNEACDHEFESLVTQACAVDSAWKSGEVWIKREEMLRTQFKVVELKFVPGGKFLVASVRDRMGYRSFIMVYAIDLIQGTRAIARMETSYQCYDLDAKYMEHEGEPGIMIYFTRRHWMKPTNLDDPGVRHLILQKHTMIYKEQDIVIAREKDAYIQRAMMYQRPFRNVMLLRGKAEISMPTLFEWKGNPHLAFFVSPLEIKLLCLNGPYRATITPAHDNSFLHSQQRIRAIRPIPSQDQILVIRTFATHPQEEFVHRFELYDIPAEGGDHAPVHPAAQSPPNHLADYRIDKFTISDAPDPTKKMHPSHPQPLHHELCPSTIWISSSNISPPGVCMWAIRPLLQPQILNEPPTYRYGFTLLNDRPCSIHCAYPDPKTGTGVALPGSERSLVYNFIPSYTESMIVQRIKRFWYDPELFEEGYHEADKGDSGPSISEVPHHSYKKFQDVLSTRPIIPRMNQKGGAVSIAFDEGSGKIAIGVSNENEIQLYDTGTAVPHKQKLIYEINEALKHPIYKDKLKNI
ncbi:hypothetical protein CVT24_001049 [Panaeolus cyanescens]|uniref:Uncharacterized protein n=1 Tax=Panaeolus cyanescens TaxID=181874 RepID=A0A409W7A8_9AGAR|nr:hypothetical protein CVT24_001049 [Panaeolus cyanescens]